MGILTNFLKLLKPEPNDFVDVAKHISENYDKLDQNAEATNRTLTNLSNNKLDKGTYPGNASDLNTEIDGKVSKYGDTITGTLNINMEGKDKVVLKSKGTTDGVVGSDTDGVIVENSKSGKSIRLDNDGVGIYPSTSLKTEAKDLSGAVNELLDSKYKIEYKTIGSPTKELDILEFAMTAVEGNYRSQVDNNLITSLPEGVVTKAFECKITSINGISGYKTIELKPFNSNDIYINTQINFIHVGYHPIWLGWNKLLNDRDGVILDKQDKGVLGGYSGTFPLTTAVKEGIYLLPATNKFYVCVENYSGSSLTAPNANFEELSVFQNRNKLENLFKNNEFKVLKNFPLNTIKLDAIPQEFSLTLEEMKALEYVVVYDVDFIESSKSKFIFGPLARAESGEYWIQTPSGEQINFRVSGSRLYLSATFGSQPVFITSIFYR